MVDRAMTRADRPAWVLPIAIVLTALFAGLGIHFAIVQNIWIDESTQLAGSGLPFAHLIAWLAGHPEPLGVPADRMPPLGYVADWLWRRLAGPAPFGFRLLHLAFASAGVAGLILLAGRRYGPIAAFVTGGLLAASPGLITAGVEIRAYPIFFAATVLQLRLLFGLFDGVTLSRGRLAAFTLAGVATVYVHFFGLVSSSALFVGLIAARARTRAEWLVIGLAWGVLLVASAGIAPFVGGARAISDDPAPAQAGLETVIAYLPRIYGHAAMLLYPLLAAFLFVCLAALLLIAVLRAIAALPSPLFRVPASPEVAVAAAIAAGLVATIGASSLVHGFEPMKPSYSIWLVAPIALLAGAACAPGGTLGRVAVGVAAALLVALAPISIAFARDAGWFVHGPERAVAAELDNAPGAAIVYLDRSWAYAYFPLRYLRHGSVAQFLLGEDGSLRRLTDGDPHPPPVPLSALSAYRTLLLVSIQTRTGGDLGDLREGVADPILFTPPSVPFEGWHVANGIVTPGLYWLRLVRIERN